MLRLPPTPESYQMRQPGGYRGPRERKHGVPRSPQIQNRTLPPPLPGRGVPEFYELVKTNQGVSVGDNAKVV